MKKPQRGRMFFDDAEFWQLINAYRLPNRRHPASNLPQAVATGGI
jgi:hypothetical protein